MPRLPAERSVSCADGYPLRYRSWRPEHAAHATIALFNGVMSHSGWFQPLAESLVRAGFTVIGADRRGSGSNELARGDAPSARTLLKDAERILENEHTDGSPLHLAGWCWGAVLAINLAAHTQRPVDSLVLLAPGLHPTEVLLSRMARERQQASSSPADLACLRSPIEEEMFTRGPQLESFIARDEQRCQHISPRFADIMSKMAMGATIRLRQLALPMLLVLAEDDRATDNEKTLRTFARLPKAPVSIEHVDSAHGIQFDAPEELGRILTAWILDGPGGATA